MNVVEIARYPINLQLPLLPSEITLTVGGIYVTH